MSEFAEYLAALGRPEAEALRRLIATVLEHVPEATPGLAYGMPAFRYAGRPLIGFSSNQFGLNLYPFDPRIIAALASELRDFELGKGVVRFSPAQLVPAETVRVMLELRIAHLEK